MKTLRFLMIIVTMLIALPGCSLWGSMPAKDDSSGTFQAKDLPPLLLNQCVAVQKVVSKNPFSPAPNDFFLLTRYEENSVTAAQNEIPLRGKKLNIYGIQGFFITEVPSVGIVSNTALIVEISDTDDASSQETLQKWIIVDDNGDLKIDRAFFKETVSGKGEKPVGSHKAEFSRDRLAELQKYYDKANVSLAAGAAKKPFEQCILI